jgi:hypothetical protein
VAKKTKSTVQPAAPANPAAAPPPASPATPPAPPTSLITTTANASNHGTKVDFQASIQAVIFGLLTYYEPTDTFVMNGTTYTRDELVAEFQSFVTAAQATKTSNQQWRGNVQSERVLELHVRALRKGVQGIVAARFGEDGAQNLQFGFPMEKPRAKSAVTKAVAVQKGLATRKERGTMSKADKMAIKGNVNVALVVTPGPVAAQPVAAGAAPQVASPAPVAPAAPAPAATPASGGAVPPHTGGTGP